MGRAQVTAERIAEIRMSYQRELCDKLMVATVAATSALPLQAAIAQKQAQEFLCDMFRDLLSALSFEQKQRREAERNLEETHRAWNSENELRRDAEAERDALKQERDELARKLSAAQGEADFHQQRTVFLEQQVSAKESR